MSLVMIPLDRTAVHFYVHDFRTLSGKVKQWHIWLACHCVSRRNDRYSELKIYQRKWFSAPIRRIVGIWPCGPIFSWAVRELQWSFKYVLFKRTKVCKASADTLAVSLFLRCVMRKEPKMRELDQNEKYHKNKTKKEKMKLQTILCKLEK